MEIEYDSWRDDHAVDISSDHESAAPSQANSVADQHTSLMATCDTTGTAAATSTAVHQTSSSADHHRQNLPDALDVCRNIATVILLLLVIIVVTLITGSLALVFTCTLIPGIIICLVLAYMITSLYQFSRCDDYADLDDEYDTDLGTYRYELVVWMFQLTGILVGELLLCLALFRIGPFALRRLTLLDVLVWKWFLIGIIVLVYFGFWLLTHIVIHKARDKLPIRLREVLFDHKAREKKSSNPGDEARKKKSSSPAVVFFRVHVLPILKGLLGLAVCGFYFLVELLILKLAPPLRRPKIIGLYAYKWMHALVYVFIGLNASRTISASIVAMLQKKLEQYEKSDDNTNPTAPRKTVGGLGEEVLDSMRMGCLFIMRLLFKLKKHENEGGAVWRCQDLSRIQDFLATGCTVIMGLLFRRLDPKKFTIYVVIGLRRSINFVLVSIWLLVTWISHFEHQLKPSHDTTWILRVGTGTLISLLICAILWLVKNSIMLWWKYRSIYNKFHDDVLKEGSKLYLLGMICGQHLDVLKVEWSTRQEKKIKQGAHDQNNNYKDSKVVDGGKKDAEEENIKKGADQNKKNNSSSNDSTKVDNKKKNAEESRKRRRHRVVAKARRTLVEPAYLMKAADHQKGDHHIMNSTVDDEPFYQPGIYAIVRMVRYFLRAEDAFKKDMNTSIGKLLNRWRQAHLSHDQNARSEQLAQHHIKEAYGTDLDEKDFEILRRQMINGDEKSEKQVNLQDFERWMEGSHKTCYNRASTLASAQHLAKYLNRVMIAVIILATFCFWLLLVTRSTKTVGLLGAPLVALSFIFGETCSTVFNGIIFLYVIHPYDIGDICIINGTLYEVKQIDFWTTTFLKVETKVVVPYPNSALFQKPIINMTKEEDGYDSIEFILESNTEKQNILELTRRIDNYFLKEQSTNFQKPRVEIKYGIGDTGKQNVIIRFKHNFEDIQGMSNSEHVQEMKKRKDKLGDHVTELCTELKIKLAKDESD